MASATGGGAERIEINTSVGVRGANGMFFGNVRWLEPKRLLIEIAAEFEAREAVDVRINLMPTSATALLTGRVDRALATAKDEVSRYLIDVTGIGKEDKERLDAWIQNVKGRGTFSNFDVMSSSHQGTAQSPSDVRQALQMLSQRPLSSTPTTDAFGVRSDVVTTAASSGGRTGVRDALREALTRRSAPGRVVAEVPAAPAPPRVDPSRANPGRVVATQSVPPRVGPRSVPPGSSSRIDAVSPAPAPKQGIAQPATIPQGTTEPIYASRVAGGETWMEVRWRTPAIFERDARLQLSNYMLVLARAEAPLPDGPVRLMLRHADFALDCGARLRASGAHGATWQLDLDALQLERIRQWLKDYGKK
jgi:hypothetical protein